MVYLLGTLTRNYSASSGNGRTLLVLLATVVASVALWLGGHHWYAVTVAGAAPAVLGSTVGMLALAFLTFGRNMRWN